MTTCVSINGLIGDEQSATISVLDRGFLYGDSIYEVMRTYDGQPFAMEEHLERLANSGKLLAIPLPISRQQLAGEILATNVAAENGESYIRVIITRGQGQIGLDPNLAADPSRVIIVAPLEAPDPALYESGVKICLVPSGRTKGAVPLGAKSGNYLNNLMALRSARAQGGHEAILIDSDGRIAEGATSNVFGVFGDRLVTPPLDVGILEGITRRKVIELGREIGLVVREDNLRSTGIMSADEVFLTSTLREILPVTRVGEHVVGVGIPGPVTASLRAAFQELVVQCAPLRK